MTTLTPGWVFDSRPIPDPHGRAARMLEFADLLRHPNAEGPDRRPLRSRWQRRIIEGIYGPSDENGRRKIRTVFVLLPRGARKTTLAAVLALGHTIGPEQRRRGQVISAAGDRDQARTAFEEAIGMVLEDEILEEATRIRDTKNRIEHRRSASAYMAISADGRTKHGKTPAFVLADELHVWRGPKGMGLWTALSTGASKTAGSLKVIITTSGERPEGICWDIYTYALKVLENPDLDPSFLPIIFQADPKSDWLDEDLWGAVNPGLADGFPDIEELRSEARMARFLPKLREAFRQTHLNIWSDGSAAGWVDMAVYDEAAEPIDEEALRGRKCWIGVDLSKSYDLAAIEAVFPDDDGGFTILSFPFIPESTFNRRAEETDVAWQEWKDKHITVIPGDLIDDDVIKAKLRELARLYNVEEINFDPKYAAKMMAELHDEGLPALELPQRPLIMGPFYHQVQTAIIGRKFRHGGHPVLRWCVQSASPKYGDTGLPFLSKKKQTLAIDCIVAAAMGLGRASAIKPPGSPYNNPKKRPQGFRVMGRRTEGETAHG